MPARMTRRQMVYLGLGIAFLLVGVIVASVLWTMEGNVINKDGQELIYTVDPNVYVVMLIISLIGVLIILLTVAENRWQRQNDGKDVGLLDLIGWKGEKKGPVKQRAPGGKGPKNKPGNVPVRKDQGSPPKRIQEPLGKKGTERSERKANDFSEKRGTGTARAKRREAARPETEISIDEMATPDLFRGPGPVTGTGSATKSLGVLDPSSERMVGTDAQNPSVTTCGSVTASPESIVPIMVESLGRCPMCGKVIVLGRTECVKCGWKVVPERMIQFEDLTDI
jgi:hypothetical protein